MDTSSSAEERKPRCQTKYKKTGSTGIEGILFQVNLLTVVLLNAFRKCNNWKLSTENKHGGKFDDIVLELLDGDILLQAKHRRNRRITFNELFSVNSKNDDFSLGKYFFSYHEVRNNFKNIKYVIICTNAEIQIDDDTNTFFTSHRIGPENVLHLPGEEYTFYKLTNKILPKLTTHVRSYYDENMKGKNIDKGIMTSENIKEFLRHFRFYTSYPCEQSLTGKIECLLLNINYFPNLCHKTCTKYMHNKVFDWFRQQNGEYWTSLHVKAICCEMKSNNFCDLLERYNVTFQEKALFMDGKRILHITSKTKQVLNILSIYQSLKNKSKVLYVQSDDLTLLCDAMEAFRLPQYTHLIIVDPPTAKEAIAEIGSKLKEILQKCNYKYLILIAEHDSNFPKEIGWNNVDYSVIEECITFKKLSPATQQRLLKTNVVFQGIGISLEELLQNSITEDCEEALSSEVLEEFVTNKSIVVGSPVPNLSDGVDRYYIPRRFIRETSMTGGRDKKIESLTEEDIYKVTEKLVLIADAAGTGKSTVITKLGTILKERFPHLWVIPIKLNDYSKILKDFKSRNMDILDLINASDLIKLNHPLEQFIFSINRKVVLIFDGVDEISPDYNELVSNLIQRCQNANNVDKIFVTTRLHLTMELEEQLDVLPFTLQPFTEKDQVNFLTSYWINNLELSSADIKCKRYAAALLSKKVPWFNLKPNRDNNFVSVPLQLKMLADIFLEGCREYVRTTDAEPKFPENIDIVTMFQLFIQTKIDIFVKKENPDGRIEATKALLAQAQECEIYHRILALDVMFHDTNRLLFKHPSRCEKELESCVLKIGIVQKLDEEVHFVHRMFVEYFVADCLHTDLWTNNDIKFHKFFFNEVLAKPEFNVTRTFLDALLQKTVSVPNIYQNHLSSACTDDDKKFNSNLIHILAEEGCLSILKLIFRLIDFKPGTGEVNISELRENFEQQNNNCALCKTVQFSKCMTRRGGLNITDEYNQTPLHYAVTNGHLKMVKFLVQCGANVNLKAVDGRTTLWQACVWNNHLDIVEYLVQQGVNIDKKDNEGYAVLHYATYFRSWRTVQFLITSGADVNVADKYGRTVMHSSALMTLELFKFVVSYGGNIHITDNRGISLIHVAASEGYLDTLKYFVECGANVNITDNYGHSVLYSAALHGNSDVAKYLVLNIDEENAYATLHKAVLMYNLGVIETLLGCGLNVNVRDNLGRTILHLAASKGQSDTVELLVRHGVEINASDCTAGRTALHLAALDGQMSVVIALVERGAKIDARDRSGCTALHLAALATPQSGNSALLDSSDVVLIRETIYGGIVKFLTDRGADVSVRDCNGDTAAAVAVREGNIYLLGYLEKDERKE